MSALRRVPVAGLLIALVVTPSAAQGVRIDRPEPRLFEVSGGSGGTAWRLRYGTVPPIPTPTVVMISPDRAYLVHGAWLRLLDTANGVVLGRWRFPHFIEQVTPDDGGRAQVRIRSPYVESVTVPFDPRVGRVPPWESGALISFRTADAEALQLLRAYGATNAWLSTVTGAADGIPAVEDLVRRDPTAPWLRLALAKLMLDAGDPRAASVLDELRTMPGGDFSEWFGMTSILEALRPPQPALAARVFDRGMSDFLRRGRDPRLVDTMIARLVLLPAASDLRSMRPEVLARYLERVYLVAPTSEATDRGWALVAESRARAGDADGAAVWRSRAEASRRESLLMITVDVFLQGDRALLLAIGAVLAAALFIAFIQVRHGAQRRMERIAAARGGVPRSGGLGLRFWSGRERWSLLLIAAVGWAAIGTSWTSMRMVMVSASQTIHVGEVGGPDDEFQITRYPAGPERDLLLAVSYHHSGRLEDAERLYLALPQFAQSWNNVGVIRDGRGDAAGGGDAFARALAVAPDLPEAVLNARGQATTPTTQLFQSHAADRKMIAVPSREQVLRARLGPEWSRRHAAALLGPIYPLSRLRAIGSEVVAFVVAEIAAVVILVLMLCAVSLIAFVPYRDASVPPGRWTRVLELVLPGLSPRWHAMSGIVLLAWSTLVLAVILQPIAGSPYLLSAQWHIGEMGAFGYPSSPSDLNPPWPVLVAMLAILWVANAVLIRSSRGAGSVQ